jgi:hypothetical protein
VKDKRAKNKERKKASIARVKGRKSQCSHEEINPNTRKIEKAQKTRGKKGENKIGPIASV